MIVETLELNGSKVFSAGWTELLLDTERIADITAVLLERLYVNRKLDSLSDLALLAIVCMKSAKTFME